MISACPIGFENPGVVRSLLSATNCNVRGFTEAGYKALAGPHSIFPTVLTAMLTIYVALLGYQLLLGRGGLRLSDAPLAALKIGAIAALALNWNTFQTVVLDLSAGGPLQIAHIVGTMHGDPLTHLQTAYDELLADQTAYARGAGANPLGLHSAQAGTADGLSYAAIALLCGTVGILAFATVVTGVLVALGPVFIALFLFGVTRGLFVGWVRALLAAAFLPMVCWITTVVSLLTLEPWLAALAQERETAAPSVDTATVVIALVMVFTAAQFVLLAASGVIALGFRLRSRGAVQRSQTASRETTETEIEPRSRARQLAAVLERAALSEANSRTSYAAGSAQVLAGGSGGTVYQSSPRAVRLGESVRRNAYRGFRTRTGA